MGHVKGNVSGDRGPVGACPRAGEVETSRSMRGSGAVGSVGRSDGKGGLSEGGEGDSRVWYCGDEGQYDTPPWR